MKYMIAAIITLLSLPSFAEARFGEISIKDGGRLPDVTQVLSVDIDLNDGWHSYWRLAGQNGLDPVIDLSKSVNLSSYEIHWPKPTLVGEDGLEAVGYADDFQVLLSLKAKDSDKPIKLSLIMDIGVCDVQCVPVHREINVELNSGYSIDGVALKSLFEDKIYQETCAPLSTDPSSYLLFERKNGNAILTPRDKPRQFDDVNFVYEASRSDFHALCE